MDSAQRGIRVGRIATGQEPDPKKSRHRNAGFARAAALTPERRSEIARMGAAAAKAKRQLAYPQASELYITGSVDFEPQRIQSTELHITGSMDFEAKPIPRDADTSGVPHTEQQHPVRSEAAPPREVPPRR